MIENKCKIIQDLLPTYLENMTSEETTTFIEEHLKNCSECNKIHANMKESIQKETLENTEIIKKIKKYKRRINLIRAFFLLAILSLPLIFIINTTFKFYIIRKAYERNTNYKNFESFTVEEYADSVEHYEKHYTTYYKNDIMKKYYGNNPVEYYDGENHYFFDNENMTYWVKKEQVNTSLNIDISILTGMENIVDENGINNFEILKFVLFQDDLIIRESGFREKPYYLISSKGSSIWIDQDTFFAERLVKDDIPDVYEEPTEYRLRTANVGWSEIKIPYISKYTLIEK